MRERDRARRLWRRRRDNHSYNIFKQLRNYVQDLVRSAKRNYYLNSLNVLRDSSSVWHKLRQLGLIKSRVSERVLPCSIDELNNYFARISGSSGSQSLFDYTVTVSQFDDQKFYWKHIIPQHIFKVFGRSSLMELVLIISHFLL